MVVARLVVELVSLFLVVLSVNEVQDMEFARIVDNAVMCLVILVCG